jgi:hypothetical protein
MSEMWFPDPDDGVVEKRYKFPLELVARMHRAAREDGLDEESYVIAAIEKSLVRQNSESSRH